MIDCLIGALAGGAAGPGDRRRQRRLDAADLRQLARRQGRSSSARPSWAPGAAASTHDGQEGVPHLGANQSNVPIEMIESNYPMRIEQLRHRAGHRRRRALARRHCRWSRDYRVLSEEAMLNIRSDKRRFPPHGLFGGGTGAPSLNLINPERREPAAAGADDRGRAPQAGRSLPATSWPAAAATAIRSSASRPSSSTTCIEEKVSMRACRRGLWRRDHGWPAAQDRGEGDGAAADTAAQAARDCGGLTRPIIRSPRRREPGVKAAAQAPCAVR
jgi:hypothetical protein